MARKRASGGLTAAQQDLVASKYAELEKAESQVYSALFPWFRAERIKLLTAGHVYGDPATRELWERARQAWQKLTRLPPLVEYEDWIQAAQKAGYDPAAFKAASWRSVVTWVSRWAANKLGAGNEAVDGNLPPFLEKDDVTILESLARRNGIVAYQVDITEVGRDRASERLRYLASVGYVQNPPGKTKKGWILTAAGMNRLAELPAVD